ncbi:MBL fold metallo-hydrolase [Anaeroarcus burkinensis]|uniref:MBL fold metallo-hydrolase n=1 Tax=Anaeroarcus burkinensis TaxID=82376 RepID=UPI0003F7C43E|nr:MBL fold metallo-hydrolase [Anaeroarcus burkinensis]
MKNYCFQYGFHGVGHGLFWTGKLNGLNIVYDCGSRSSQVLKTSINNYTPSHIEILIISHFHQDHVKGVKELFSKKTCGTIFIPYYHPDALKYIELNYVFNLILENKMPTDSDKDYLLFLNSPSEYLFKFTNAEKIITIFPSENRLDDNYSSLLISYDSLSSEQSMLDNSIINITYQNRRNCTWLLKFFNLPYSNNIKVKEYVDRLKKRGINTWEDMLNITTQDLVMHILKTFNMDNSLSSTERNFTSLAVSIIPEGPCPTPSGIMLTGDLELNRDPKQQLFLNHYKSELPQIAFFQYPHHGSNDNMPNTISLSTFSPTTEWIISKKHISPNSSLPDIIAKNNFAYEIVTEKLSLVYSKYLCDSRVHKFTTSPNDSNFTFPISFLKQP